MLRRSVFYLDQRYEALLDKEEDGGFSVSAPAVPGAYSDGDTEAEALENIVDAIASLKESTLEVAKILKAHDDRQGKADPNLTAPPSQREVATD